MFVGPAGTAAVVVAPLTVVEVDFLVDDDVGAGSDVSTVDSGVVGGGSEVVVSTGGAEDEDFPRPHPGSRPTRDRTAMVAAVATSLRLRRGLDMPLSLAAACP